MKLLGFTIVSTQEKRILKYAENFRESKFDQAQSRRSQQSSCSRLRECFPAVLSTPLGLNLPELALPLLGLPEGPGSPLLETLHARRGAITPGGEQSLVTRLTHQLAVRGREEASHIQLVRASHDGAPDALSVPGLPVCPKHLLRGVNILVAGGAGVAGSPLGLVAH